MLEKYVRAKVEGRRAVQGTVVGESHEGECWVIERGDGMRESWHKEHCQEIKAEETSKAVRHAKRKRLTEN